MNALPTLNAFLNGTSAVLLLVGLYHIKRRNIAAHRTCMTSAFVVSVLFLISYITYHLATGVTRFKGQGLLRIIYFVILTSHTILAAIVPVLAITTLVFAWRGNFPRHTQFARWTWPIWMYVSVTGVVIYIMLYEPF